MKGYEYYRFIENIYENFDELKETVATKLNDLIGFIFNRDNLKVSFTADKEGYELFNKAFEKFLESLPNNDFEKAKRLYVPTKSKTGFTSSSQVQYVAMCGNYVKEGFNYTGALKVLKVIFSYDYLWINVRVKGGAYGCNSSFFRNGDMYMSSYRDPNLKGTIDIFKKAYEYVENFDVSDRDMLKYIIGTIGDLDTPLNSKAKGVRSFSAYLSHADYETFAKERREILNCDVNAIRALAPIVKLSIGQDYLSVVGNQQVIQDNKDIFDEIKPLIISATKDK
jgi:Zn-dependent M16 (insulinase) family peptidase